MPPGEIAAEKGNDGGVLEPRKNETEETVNDSSISA